MGWDGLKGRITLETELTFTVGHLAYLSSSWSLSGTGPNGEPVALGATTAEVARRQGDGAWRYLMGNACAIRRAVDRRRSASEPMESLRWFALAANAGRGCN